VYSFFLNGWCPHQSIGQTFLNGWCPHQPLGQIEDKYFLLIQFRLVRTPTDSPNFIGYFIVL
jgi:hypothetical protein